MTPRRTAAPQQFDVRKLAREQMERSLEEVKRGLLERRSSPVALTEANMADATARAPSRDSFEIADTAPVRPRRGLTFSQAFAVLPMKHRLLLIISTYLLALSIAGSAHLLYSHWMAAKRSLYVAADGRGEQGSIHLLSVPAKN